MTATATRKAKRSTSLCVLYAFLYISLPSLHDYDVKIPNFTYYGGDDKALYYFVVFRFELRSKIPEIAVFH